MTAEERVKMFIGEMVINLQVALAEIEQLKKQLAEKDRGDAEHLSDRR